MAIYPGSNPISMWLCLNAPTPIRQLSLVEDKITILALSPSPNPSEVRELWLIISLFGLSTVGQVVARQRGVLLIHNLGYPL